MTAGSCTGSGQTKELPRRSTDAIRVWMSGGARTPVSSLSDRSRKARFLASVSSVSCGGPFNRLFANWTSWSCCSLPSVLDRRELKIGPVNLLFDKSRISNFARDLSSGIAPEMRLDDRRLTKRIQTYRPAEHRCQKNSYSDVIFT